ncbi:hypothetical protein BCR32DRAFT_245006 [Anaeromyces robustus]|uniref:Transmembrane protein n=1 Tax=Anaeromyces robustus TaxID=1754192 RepID=A0A1Y1X7A5_9FUNG|nr:hypothetical protein BCR32DRAFT_245006 [Anaeromyces robustus]|eukprot:ORX81276.1 hypothetical protein BCR32DRAFT_245006 [Anaeromyces robustus]
MFIYYQKSFLKLTLLNIFALAIHVNAISINTTVESNSNGTSIIKLPIIITVLGVVAVLAAGGFCLFSSKKNKRLSEEYLTKPNSNQTTPSTTPSSSHSEIREANVEIGETDLSIKVDKMDNEDNNLNDEQKNTEEGDELNVEQEPQKKRKSFLDALLARTPKKEKRASNIQFIEDRSLNSISTNEDWINEQKYQADLQIQEGRSPENMYEDEEVNSNDGFWNSDLEPIQSSANNNKKESYAVPSLGSRNSVIIKGSEQNQTLNRHSVIIVNDDNTKTNRTSVGSNSSEDLKPTRVRSWKNNDYDKEIMEMIKHLDEKEELKEEIENKINNHN